MGESKHITLIINNKRYHAKINNADRKNIKSDTIRILYTGNSDLISYLNEKFKYTSNLLQENDKVETDEYIDFL